MGGHNVSRGVPGKVLEVREHKRAAVVRVTLLGDRFHLHTRPLCRCLPRRSPMAATKLVLARPMSMAACMHTRSPRTHQHINCPARKPRSAAHAVAQSQPLCWCAEDDGARPTPPPQAHAMRSGSPRGAGHSLARPLQPEPGVRPALRWAASPQTPGSVVRLSEFG